MDSGFTRFHIDITRVAERMQNAACPFSRPAKW